MQYKQIKDQDGNVENNIIKMTADDGVVWFIPNDINNADWKDYQAWLDADPANQPDPAD